MQPSVVVMIRWLTLLHCLGQLDQLVMARVGGVAPHAGQILLAADPDGR